jgi:Flp pilus assembly protein TadD
MRNLRILVLACCLPGLQMFGEDALSNVPPRLLPEAQEAKKQFDSGDYAGAEKIFREMLKKAPLDLYIISNLAVIFFREGKFDLAEDFFKQAIAVAPEDGFSHCTLGITYYSQAKYDDALNELTKALAIDSKNSTAHNYLGIVASQKGWEAVAITELKTAATLDPGYADACFNLAVVFSIQTPPNKKEGRKYYERALKLGSERDAALEDLIGWHPKAVEPPKPDSTPNIPPALFPEG